MSNIKRNFDIPPNLVYSLVLLVVMFFLLVPQITVTWILGASNTSELGLFRLVSLYWEKDPAAVTGSRYPGFLHHVLVWAINLSVLALAAAWFTYRTKWYNNPQNKQGLEKVSAAVKALGTHQLLKQRAPKLAPNIKHPTPHQVGYTAGEYHGNQLWLSVEDPTILIGPSRAGKGFYLVLNWIVSAPGAVITTSSKMDNALMTLKHRERLGSKCWVFAPGIAGGKSLGRVLKWNPVTGCEDEETLVRRIHALIPSDSFSGSTSNGGHWDTLGRQMAAHLFHAAACAGADVNKIWEWVSNPQRALEAVQVIREHPKGLKEHANHLEQVINMPQEQRASSWGVLPTVLAFMDSGIARDWMCPAGGDEIDIIDFIANKGTLYLVGDKETTSGYVRIIDGLLAEIDYVAKGIADASAGARLEPALSYILDEAGNFEYQGLYELITAGGGRGRVPLVVFQSKSQLDQWGAEQAKAMWDAAAAKIILPGGADRDELEALSRLIGEEWNKQKSYTYNGIGASSSMNVSLDKRSIIEASEIRTMPQGYALLFYKNLKPIVSKLSPFTDNPAYAACKQDSEELAAEARRLSPFYRG